MAKILCNYADGNYYQSQQLNAQTALTVAGFDKVYSYGREDLPKWFLDDNESVLSQTRGAGYWLWKPFIILTTMAMRARDGDLVFYADSGSYFVASMEPIFKIIAEKGFFISEVPHPEKEWTKGDLFKQLGLTSSCYSDSNQRNAAFIGFRNNEDNRRLVKEWLSWGQHGNLITDVPSSVPNDVSFKEHRHDQSIVSLLTKKWDLPCYDDPTQWGDKCQGRPYPRMIIHTRDRR